jgi:hypothetical protein
MLAEPSSARSHHDQRARLPVNVQFDKPLHRCPPCCWRVSSLLTHSLPAEDTDPYPPRGGWRDARPRDAQRSIPRLWAW